jgi:acetate kinase
LPDLKKWPDQQGLCGVSADFRELLASGEPLARFAIEVFCYHAAGHIASLVAAFGGLDAIVSTAGVGENAARVRSAICRRAIGWGSSSTKQPIENARSASARRAALSPLM